MSTPSKKAKTTAGSSAVDDRRSGRLRTKVRVRSVVDPETRRQVAAARLAALEQDNFEEGQALVSAAAASGDAAYEDEDEEVEQGGGGGAKGRKRKAVRTAGSRGAGAASASAAGAADSSAAAAGISGVAKGSDRAAKAVVHRHRNLDYVVAEEEYDSDGVNYKTIAAGPSARPPRYFCSACGFLAPYTCPRCGLRFCCLRCQSTHKETRCVKFAE